MLVDSDRILTDSSSSLCRLQSVVGKTNKYIDIMLYANKISKMAIKEFGKLLLNPIRGAHCLPEVDIKEED